MKVICNVLIIDDHPMTVDAYINLISASLSDFDLSFFTANSCESAYKLISSKENSFDMAFVDINLPPYEPMKLHSGVDLAVLIRSTYPKCKIIMLSMHSEPVIVNEIRMAIDPEGFISKSDIDFNSFSEICLKIINNEQYYSESILEAQQQLALANLKWDEFDVKIVQLIAEGFKTNEIPDIISLSLSAIEKRKARLKKQLIFEKGSDKELIQACKKMGLI
jgi:DNA-binding NarL/FixJ family response regulator